jgi:hypothetical protein
MAHNSTHWINHFDQNSTDDNMMHLMRFSYQIFIVLIILLVGDEIELRNEGLDGGWVVCKNKQSSVLGIPPS